MRVLRPSLLLSAAAMTDRVQSFLEFSFFIGCREKETSTFVCTLSRDYNISGVYSARHCLLPSCEILIFLRACSRRFDCLSAKLIIYFLINKLNIGKLFPVSWRHACCCIFPLASHTTKKKRGRIILTNVGTVTTKYCTYSKFNCFPCSLLDSKWV